MKRLAIPPRVNWQELVESVGMTYHTIDDELYWDESACYRFTRHEVDTLGLATAELHNLCLQAVEEVIRTNLFSCLRIPRNFVPAIISSWENDDPSIYGRFDLSWGGSGAPKLLRKLPCQVDSLKVEFLV